jgi:hypothetical protein
MPPVCQGAWIRGKYCVSRLSPLLFVAFACALPAQAEELRVSGFGTLGYSRDNAEHVGFIRNITQPASEDSQGSFVTDSQLGIQLNYRPHPEFEAVVQAVARDKKYPTPANSIEWAFLAWRPNEALDLRLGRVGTDVFMLSDYRNLGYSQLWVRPPTEFYGWIPFFSIDGGDAAYTFKLDDTRIRVKAQAGNAKSYLPAGANEVHRFEVDKFQDLTLQAERGPWQFKAGYSEFTVGEQPELLSQLSAPLNQISALAPPPISGEAAQLASGLKLEGAKVRYQSLGAAYDDGVWQLQGEVARVDSDSRLLPAGRAAYASVGRRFGAVTPYVVASRFSPDNPAVAAGSDWSILGPLPAYAQAAAVAAYNTYRIDQSTRTLGLRWDIASRAALKVQWDRSHVDSYGYGLWQISNIERGGTSRHIDVFTVTLDFVF